MNGLLSGGVGDEFPHIKARFLFDAPPCRRGASLAKDPFKDEFKHLMRNTKVLVSVPKVDFSYLVFLQKFSTQVILAAGL
jgi:hypothetical protein